MTSRSFFPRGEGFSLTELADLCGAELLGSENKNARISGIAGLAGAGSDDLAFFDNPLYEDSLRATAAGAVVTLERFARLVPAGIPVIVARDVSLAFTLAGRALFPGALAPGTDGPEGEISPLASVHSTARLEADVTVEPFAVIGPNVEIGRGSVVASHAVIGAGVRIGRDSRIGSHVSLQHSLIGNRVILHPGARLGQDGFGYAPGPNGIVKAVQIGRVIVQDDVEIGANTTIDRGAVRDTVIGEGTKIDNQVQVGHNVVMGRSCLIVAQVGIAGSTTLGNGVAIGGQVGVNGHVTIGDGAQIAAASAVAGHVPAKARWGGTPARPVREWIREQAFLRELAKAGRGSKRDNDE